MKKKLLVIDDSAFDREVLKKVFSRFYSIRFALSENLCYQRCCICNPDVVYYELRTAQADLLEKVCTGVADYHPSTPLIITASENNASIERLARIHGVFYYLIRPFNFLELWDVFDAAFDHAARTVRSFGQYRDSCSVSPEKVFITGETTIQSTEQPQFSSRRYRYV